MGVNMNKAITRVAFLAAIIPLLAHAQPDTLTVPDFFDPSQGGEGTLNTAVTNAINGGTLSTTVFKLIPFGYYVLNSTITVPAGTHLTIVAGEPGTDQPSAPPQIVWSSSTGLATFFNFDCFGDITLKNIWILYANTSGNQTGTSLRIEDSPDEVNGQHGTFEGVLFDYSQIGADGSGAVSVTSRHFRGKFTNCYFRNCSDPHYRYYGRAVSFPFNTTGWRTDSLTFVNCTFSNLGYVIMQEGSEYTDYLSMNHCTLINTVMFCLESPWWHYLSVTNSVFQNMYMYGSLIDTVSNPTGEAFGGTFGIDSVSNFGFSPPFTDQDRHILFANCAYYIEPWLTDYMAHNAYSDTVQNPGYIPKPMPMLSVRSQMFFDTTDGLGNKSYPYMNGANLIEGVDPAFPVPPTNVEAIKRFLYYKWTTNSDTNWAYDPASSILQHWPLSENLRIATSSPLKTAAMGGFPLGDLYRWDISKYTTWKAQEASENTQIKDMLDNGITGVVERPGIAGRFELSQNYPNPFNPTTKIDYSILKSGHVSLKVYNLLGEEVSTLYDGEQKVGHYTATFNGSNLASGVYFYRLQSGGNSIAKKLVLMK